MSARRVGMAALLTAGLTLSGCSTVTDPWKDLGGPPRVVVTFPPLASFVKNVGGEHVGVICICTATGPHDYKDPTADDFIALREADLFLINGLALDDVLAKHLKASSGNAKLVFVELGEKLPRKLLLKAEQEEGDKDKKHDHEHEHGEWDPHVWLGIPQACALVEQIRDQLKEIDRSHAADYDRNAAKYIEELKSLQKEYRDKFAAKKKEDRKLVSFHDSLRYFADGFGLEIVDVIEKKPGEELSAAQMNDLVKSCLKEKPRVIAVETQYPEKAADELRNELKKRELKDVKLVTVDPLETTDLGGRVKRDDSEWSQWYVRKMRENLDNLLGAMP